MLENVIARRVSSLSEEHSFHSAHNVADHFGRSIDTAPDFRVQQIHETWQDKDEVATLLSLEMTEAFDKVVLARLLHNTRERKIPDYLPMHIGIPQGSPLLPILFMNYNANHIEICNPLTLLAYGTGFVNYVYALALSRLTKEKCRMLQTVNE